MISSSYARVMAAYNRWQNESLFTAADDIGDAERRRERGAFFGSIHGTLSHLLWADRIWLSRFDRCPPPPVGQKDSAHMVDDWDQLTSARRELDSVIDAWSAAFSGDDLNRPFTWFSGSTGREATAPLSVIVAHIFNHQTHHRGQVHAMLTAAGARTEDTDLFLMPRDRWPA